LSSTRNANSEETASGRESGGFLDVTSIKEILYSRRFMREVSLLLFFFAAVGALIAGLSFAAGPSDPEILAVVVTGLIQVIIYAFLGVMLRRGSIIALWIAGVLFILDTLAVLLQPSGKVLGFTLVSRVLLVSVLFRYVQRERKNSSI
jgi:hypothetical protein